jgi:type II secretion system protein I
MEKPVSPAERQQGFTLVEMMVALAIFSLAALALLRLEGATVANTARLDDQAMAQIVARNIAVETLTTLRRLLSAAPRAPSSMAAATGPGRGTPIVRPSRASR